MNSVVISDFKFMLFLISICIVPAMELCRPGVLQSILNRKNFVTDRYFANIVKLGLSINISLHFYAIYNIKLSKMLQLMSGR